MRAIYLCLFLASGLPATAAVAASSADAVSATASDAKEILAASGVRGGLVVHLGCGDGRLTAALRAGDRYTVHGLDTDPANVAAARDYLRQQGLYGSVTIDHQAGSTLPYVDNLVNLVVVSGASPVAREEVLRVLCPRGVAVFLASEQGSMIDDKLIKPVPDAIDEWTHYMHDASGNAVSKDTVVGPPRRLQWVGSPKYSRHHDRMSSVSAVVSSGGRVFTIFDEATPASILAPPEWRLIARDAFNGTILWKREIQRWHTHLWPLKSGPAQLPRRLVAVGQRVYVTLAVDGPVQALDAATGETVHTYAGTAATEEILLDDGVLFLRVNPDAAANEYDGLQGISQAVRQPFYDEQPRHIVAVQAETGQVLWTSRQGVLPGTLAVGAEAVFFHDGQSVVALRRESGEELWRSKPVDRQRELRSLYMPTLVVYGDVVLFSGKGRGSAAAGRGKGDQLTALSAKTGAILWDADHPPSGYQSPEDVLVAGGLVWCGETTGGSGVFTGRDPHTGEVEVEFPPDTDVFWFHHRCYRGKATENYLLMSRTGVEFVDFRKQQWLVNHWVRGACLYGVMPANGLLYAPQHPCACYLEAKLSGFNALAAKGSRDEHRESRAEDRLERGPAYDPSDAPLSALRPPSPTDWPTYRSDNQRSGRARSAVAPNVAVRWQTDLGGDLTSPVVAAGQVYLAARDTHTVHALSATDGRQLWSFTAGGTVDSPPTVHDGRVLFGSADGYVYCLRASDGALAWRFLAAPIDQRLMAFEQLQSVWPVHGSILVQNGEAWFVAGRSVFLDGGMRLWRLDATTGQVLSETVLDDRDPASGADRHTYVSWLNMPVGLPDVLSSSGEHVYMRSQAIDRDGQLLPLEPFPRTGEGHGGRSFAPPPNQDARHAHLFSPTGFLDDAWWHRTYWLYGSRFYSGWSAYYLSGKVVPAGRLLVFDDALVYGYGRKPQYYRWTTPMENHLFAADKEMPPLMNELPPAVRRAGASPPEESLSRVQIANSASLDPAGKPLSIEAWIKADQADGVVLAHGGNSMGYALYLQQGRPHFRVHVQGQGGTVAARESIAGRWCHVAAVLTDDKKLQVYVDGALAGSATTPVFVPRQPMEGIDIGADSRTTVADYANSNQFRGQIDEIRLYHRALSGDEIARRAVADKPNEEDRRGAVLAFSFDQAKAIDLSGNENQGTIQRATSVEGRFGRALLFRDAGRGNSPSRALVDHRWSADLPLMPRAMVLADDVLFVAGPPDLVDEEQAAQTIATPDTQAAVAAQAAALEGERGAMLWAVSAADGRVLAEQSLDSPPVFDGMAAADGQLLLVTLDGRVLCLGQ